MRKNSEIFGFAMAAVAMTCTFIVSAAEQVLEEIVVTARKRTESLMETPISITAFTAMDIENRNFRDISAIAEATPNVVFNVGPGSSGNSSAASIYIRGIGQIDFTPSVEPGVGLYVDGMYISQSVGKTLNLLELESIEVLRGPQGTLFGRNSVGGAIVVRSKKPAPEFGGRVELTGGSRDRADAKVVLDIPISETFLTRISAATFNQDGFVERPNIGPDSATGDTDALAARFQALWTPSDRLEFNLSWDYTRDRENGTPTVLSAAWNLPGSFADFHNQVVAPSLVPVLGNDAFYGPQVKPANRYQDNAGTPFNSELDLWSVNLGIVWDLGWGQIDSITGYRDLESVGGIDQDHSPVIVAHTSDEINANQFSQELRLSGIGYDNRLKWLVGLYYFEEDAFNANNPVDFSVVKILSGSIVETESYALFSQGTFDLTDKASLTLGLRYTSEDKTFISDERIQYVLESKATPFPPGTRIQPIGSAGKSIDEFTPYLNLGYQWNDDLLTYISYSEGFKSGGITQRVFPPQDLQTPFEPEFANVIEGGFKWSGWDRRMRLTGAAFFTDYENLQVQVLQGIAPQTQNAAEAEISGFELEGAVMAAPGLLLTAGVGYLDAEYTEIDPAATQITLDKKPPNTPKWTLSASAQYGYQADWGTLTPRADWAYRDKYYLDADNFDTLVEDGYGLLNLSVSYLDPTEAWRLAFGVQNATNAYYFRTGIGNRFNQSFDEVTLGRKKEWYLSIEWRF